MARPANTLNLRSTMTDEEIDEALSEFDSILCTECRTVRTRKRVEGKLVTVLTKHVLNDDNRSCCIMAIRDTVEDGNNRFYVELCDGPSVLASILVNIDTIIDVESGVNVIPADSASIKAMAQIHGSDSSVARQVVTHTMTANSGMAKNLVAQSESVLKTGLKAIEHATDLQVEGMKAYGKLAKQYQELVTSTSAMVSENMRLREKVEELQSALRDKDEVSDTIDRAVKLGIDGIVSSVTGKTAGEKIAEFIKTAEPKLLSSLLSKAIKERIQKGDIVEILRNVDIGGIDIKLDEKMLEYITEVWNGLSDDTKDIVRAFVNYRGEDE